MASISITYTPNYLGCHRIYFREVGNPEYCLYVDSSGSTIGEPKTTEILLEGDYADCIDTGDAILCAKPAIEGYIQACCADEEDLESRVAFNFDIDADTCDAFNVTCNASGIAFVFMTDPGEGYEATPFINIINGGSGTGFIGTVNMDGDTVDSVTIISSGQNYPATAQISFVGGSPDRPASANLEFCPCGNTCNSGQVVSFNCVDQASETLVPPTAGESYTVCTNAIPVAVDASQLSIFKAFTTCCECTSYRITNADKERPLPIHYIDCNNVYQTGVIAPLTPLIVCAVTNSVGYNKDYPFTVVNLGSCT
jgi:hypothetical protein